MRIWAGLTEADIARPRPSGVTYTAREPPLISTSVVAFSQDRGPMNYLAFTNGSLTMMYEAVRRVFSPVDVVREARE